MKRSRTTFLVAEILLAILTIFLIRNIFSIEKPQKRIAVIVEKSGDERWDPFINGMKQAAGLQNIHLIICNTDEIEDAQEERNLIYEQLDNNIDALIIQAAPGHDVAEMLEEVSKVKPVILVVNDVLTPEIEQDIHATSEFARIMPDHYQMGYALGKELLRKNDNDIKGKTLGIVNGMADTDSAKKRQRGLEDALAGSGCEIRWRINTIYGQDVSIMVEEQEPVDMIAALETGVLEQLGETEQEVLLYGISNSTKDVYYLDTGIVESLIMADEYDMGYRSIMEMAKALKRNLYEIQNHTIDFRILQKEDIFTQEIQKFLYSYE